MGRPEPTLFSVSGIHLFINLHIQPRASRNEVCGIQGHALKVRLTSPPVDGAANKLCREFLAELMGVSKSAVEIVCGETSRHKRIRITSSDPAALAEHLEQIIIQHTGI